jgi:hypothetical protein
MRRVHAAAIVVLLIAALPNVTVATTTICEKQKHSSKELVVTIPQSSYETFVQLIRSGEIVPSQPPLAYGGGVESEREEDWFLNNSTHTVIVYARYIKPTHVFVFWVQTCQPREDEESWRPYWRSLVQQASMFPSATVKQRAIGSVR